MLKIISNYLASLFSGILSKWVSSTTFTFYFGRFLLNSQSSDLELDDFFDDFWIPWVNVDCFVKKIKKKSPSWI